MRANCSLGKFLGSYVVSQGVALPIPCLSPLFPLGLRNVMITGDMTLVSRGASMMTLSSTGTPMEKKQTGAASTVSTRLGACTALTACLAAGAASAPTHIRCAGQAWQGEEQVLSLGHNFVFA